MSVMPHAISEEAVYYMLLNPRKGKRLNMTPGGIHMEVEVERGALLREVPKLDPKVVSVLGRTMSGDLICESDEVQGLFLKCVTNELERITPWDRDILMAETSPDTRYKIYCDGQTLKYAREIAVNSRVSVLQNNQWLKGTVVYIGKAGFPRKGTFFGVRLDDRGKGDNDGSVGGHRYFTAPPKSSIFVSIGSIRLLPPPKSNVKDFTSDSRKDVLPPLYTTPSSSGPPWAATQTVINPMSPLPSSSSCVINGIVNATPLAAASPNLLQHNRTALNSTSTSNPPAPRQRMIPITVQQGTHDWVKVDMPMSSKSSELPPLSDNQTPAKRKNDNRTPPPLDVADSVKPTLSKGDRVVWITDDSVEHATVRWVGKLRPGDEWTAGLEFDNKVGSGTGNFEGRQYFEAKPGHASFVPLIGLMLADDYMRKTSRDNSASTLGKVAVQPDGKDDLFELKDVEMKDEDGFVMRTHGSANKEQANSAWPTTSRPYLQPFEELVVGSCVQIPINGEQWPAVVRWIGIFEDDPAEELMAGIETEQPLPFSVGGACDGSFNMRKYFNCPYGRGLFVPASTLHKDERFASIASGHQDFGNTDSGVVLEYVGALVAEDVDSMIGPLKGIQGHHNSCYLDATLFAMFAFFEGFDSVILKNLPIGSKEREVQKILSDEIVYPLRKHKYVRADHVMKLREHLSHLLPEIPGLTTEEKDPEELLNGLLGRILKPDPYISLSSGEQMFLCPLVVEDDPIVAPGVQLLMEKSFFHSGVNLKRTPTNFIVQLPRYGREKIYDVIIPSLELDVTHLLDTHPRPCGMCGRLAVFECKECFLVRAVSLSDATFCEICYNKVHSTLPQAQSDHAQTKLKMSRVAREVAESAKVVPSVKLQLAAVLCIETSHYVSFARCDWKDPDSLWCLQDSMADRKGGASGYNIPHVTSLEDVSCWLSEKKVYSLQKYLRDNGKLPSDLPSHVTRLLKDCYILFYVWPESEVYG